MQRWILILAMAAVLATAGCLGGAGEDSGEAGAPDAGDEAPGDPGEAKTGPFEVTGTSCEELVVWATVPAENARAVVPDGYEVQADDSGFAEAWAALKVCPEGTMDGQAIGERAQGNAGVLIEAPDGAAEPGELHFYMPWWITSRAEENERLQAQGWQSSHAPELSLAVDLVAGAGSVGAQIPWSEGSYGMTSDVAPGPHAEEYVVKAWHEGDQGTLVMDEVLSLSEHSYGPATITTEEGSPAAELFGDERPGEGLFFRFDGRWQVGPPQG